MWWPADLAERFLCPEIHWLASDHQQSRHVQSVDRSWPKTLCSLARSSWSSRRETRSAKPSLHIQVCVFFSFFYHLFLGSHVWKCSGARAFSWSQRKHSRNIYIYILYITYTFGVCVWASNRWIHQTQSQITTILLTRSSSQSLVLRRLEWFIESVCKP